MFKMMTALFGKAKVTTISATILAALMSSTASAGDGLSRAFYLVNEAQYSTVVGLHITDKRRGDWGPNLVAWDEVFPGFYKPVEPIIDRGFCKFDLRVVFDTGHTDTLWDVNLCEIYEINVNDYGFTWIYA